MDELQSPWFDFNHPDFDFIDRDDSRGEQPAEPESIPSAPPLAPNDLRTSNQGSSFEPHQERVSLSEAPAASFLQDTAMVDTWDDLAGWPSSMPAADTGNEPLHQYEQLSSTDNVPATDTGNEPLYQYEQPSSMENVPTTDTGNEPLHQYEQSSSTDVVTAEIRQIDNELEGLKLKLEQRRLQKRRQELLQLLPTPQPIQTPERPQFQNLESAIVPSIECRMGQDYNAPFDNCELDALQREHPSINSQFDLGSINLGLPSPLINPQEDPFNLGNLQQPETINPRLLNSDNVQSPYSMPTPSTDLEHNRQYGMQGPSPAFSSDHVSMRPHYEHNLMNSASLVSTMSSVQQDQHTQSPEKGLVTHKRPRIPQPNITECLSALQRQAKQTGVPQTSLNVMRLKSEPRSKRSRTSSQKQNRKDVQDAGGSCFLCLFFKKRVNL